MAGAPKEKLETSEVTETHDEEGQREMFLRDGKRLVVSDVGSDQLVEIRNESGMLELRIRLTDQGPVLQMESLRLQLKATESVEIESPRVAITGGETLELSGGAVELKSDEDVKVDAGGEVRVVGKMIYLN